MNLEPVLALMDGRGDWDEWGCVHLQMEGEDCYHYLMVYSCSCCCCYEEGPMENCSENRGLGSGFEDDEESQGSSEGLSRLGLAKVATGCRC